MKKSFVHGTRQKQHGYSAAVVTEGADRIVWLAGHSGQTADDGRSLAGDFDAQCRQTFRNIERTLREAGCELSDLVTTTTFLIDARYTLRMRELRAEFLPKNFPGSAAITVSGFADPTMMIEIQGFAVPA